jgi:hypothetical protein
MKMSNKVFDILKWVAIICLPALATFTVVVCKIWGLPYGDEIAQTITALATLLGALLGVSTVQYHNDSKHKTEGVLDEK